MKITLGLDCSDSPEDIATYVKDGADEFFVGFVPSEWYNRYGWEIPLNRRTFGLQSQLIQYQELERIIAVIHSQDKKIVIAFNAHQYSDEQIPLLREIILEVERLNPDGYIVADLALMIMLRKWGIQRPLHLSTGSACFNSQTIRYLSQKIGTSKSEISVLLCIFILPEGSFDIGNCVSSKSIKGTKRTLAQRLCCSSNRGQVRN